MPCETVRYSGRRANVFQEMFLAFYRNIIYNNKSNLFLSYVNLTIPTVFEIESRTKRFAFESAFLKTVVQEPFYRANGS
jgi:hypothetical protein